MDAFPEIMQVLVGIYFLSRIFGGKKKKKPVTNGPPPINEPVAEKQPGILEQIFAQIEAAAQESKPEEEVFQLPSPVPEIEVERVDRQGQLDRLADKRKMKSRAKEKTQLEKAFGGGFEQDQAFEDKPAYSEGRHFDTGHKIGHENDPVPVTLAAYAQKVKKESKMSELRKELAGIDLQKAVILNEILGPPAALKNRH